MNKKVINACVVGYGAIGPVHAGVIDEIEDAKLFGICDMDTEKLKEARGKYDVKVYNSFSQVLEDREVEVVHICTPHYLHVPMATAAMKSGKDVVLEKPAAMNSDEFSLLEQTVEETGRKVCFVLQNRTNNSVAEMKKQFDNPENGRLLGIEGSMHWCRTEKYYNSATWRGRWDTEGGGVLINQAVHLLDLFVYLGGEIKSVSASISTKLLGNCIEVEDTAEGLLFFKNGVRGCFYATNTYSSNKPFRIEIEYENVIYRYADNRLYKITDDVEIVAVDNKNFPGKGCWGSGHKNVISQFYHSLIYGGEYIDLKNGKNTMKAMFAFYESAKNKGVNVKL